VCCDLFLNLTNSISRAGRVKRKNAKKGGGEDAEEEED